MAQEIMLPEGLEGPLVKADKKAIAESTKGTDYLPRLAVGNGQSKLVQLGKIPQGNMYLQWDENRYKDLGKESKIIAYSFRPKALRMGDDVIAVYDINHPEFAKIQRDSEVPDSGCNYGLEFLTWIPEVRLIAALHFGSATARRESPNLLTLMERGVDSEGNTQYGPAAARLEPYLIKGKKHTWWAFRVLQLTEPVANQPEQEDLLEQINKFRNPPQVQKETADEVPAGNGRER